LLNGTSALFRPLVPRIVKIEHMNHVKNEMYARWRNEAWSIVAYRYQSCDSLGLFVCLVFNGTSGQSRLLVPRKEWIKQIKYIYYDKSVAIDRLKHQRWAKSNKN